MTNETGGSNHNNNNGKRNENNNNDKDLASSSSSPVTVRGRKRPSIVRSRIYRKRQANFNGPSKSSTFRPLIRNNEQKKDKSNRSKMSSNEDDNKPPFTRTMIWGHEVSFPYEPYGIQKVYMQKLMTCLSKSQNALLESPTGTGKTLSLLCGSLAWREKEVERIEEERQKRKEEKRKEISSSSKQKESSDNEVTSEYFDGGDDGTSSVVSSETNENFENNDEDLSYPRIVYASRTHQQLKQSMEELKKTEYAKSVIALTLASKDYYCINPEVMQLPTTAEKNNKCSELRQKDKCKYGKDINKVTELKQKIMEHHKQTENGVIDIEDMISIGQSCEKCPYYGVQKVAPKVADVIFTPYNYVLEYGKVNVKGAAVIFDEGHNIESACEDAASAAITSKMMNNTITAMKKLNDKDDEEFDVVIGSGQTIIMPKKGERDDVIKLYTRLLNEFDYRNLSDYTRRQRNTFDTSIKPSINDWFVPKLIELFAGEKAQFNIESIRKTCVTIRDYLIGNPINLGQHHNEKVVKLYLSAVESLEDFWNVAIGQREETNLESPEWKEKLEKNYGMAFEEQTFNYQNRRQSNQEKSWVLNLLCLNPAITMHLKLLEQGARSVIITSGTLAPMSTFEPEFDMRFEQKLSNRHVIKRDQLMILPITRYRARELDASYKAMQGAQGEMYFLALGQLLIDLLAIIPKGVLLFFKSYKFMTDAFSVWKSKGLYQKMIQLKRHFEEPRRREEIPFLLKEYKKCIDDSTSNGAMLSAVFRGKISEGLDISNDYCRTVFILGLPYPMLQDPYIELKRQYLDSKFGGIKGGKWYQIQMQRAVNQAIGRIIRNKNDYGLVLLVDKSFPNEQDGLSTWLKEFVEREDLTNLKERIESFFYQNQNRIVKVDPDETVIIGQSSKDSILISDDEDHSSMISSDSSVVELVDGRTPITSTPAKRKNGSVDDEDPNKRIKTEPLSQANGDHPISSSSTGHEDRIEKANLKLANYRNHLVSTLNSMRNSITGTNGNVGLESFVQSYIVFRNLTKDDSLLTIFNNFLELSDQEQLRQMVQRTSLEH